MNAYKSQKTESDINNVYFVKVVLQASVCWGVLFFTTVYF